MKILVASTVGGPAYEYAEQIIENINRLVEWFDDVECVFLESNSNDERAFSIIDSHARTKLKCKYQLHDVSGVAHGTAKVERLAIARNMIMDIVKRDYGDWDYIFMVDWNPANIQPYSKESILSNFETDIDWNVMGANQRGYYYDLWAVRHPYWVPYNIWGMLDPINRPSFISYNDAFRFVECRQITIPEDHPPIPVISAFGGAAFIRISAIGDSRYSHIEDNGYLDVEHVQFNKSIGKVFINPKFINRDHSLDEYSLHDLSTGYINE